MVWSLGEELIGLGGSGSLWKRQAERIIKLANFDRFQTKMGSTSGNG